MDNIELGQFRIRSKRRRLRAQKKDFDKKLRLCHEARDIWEAKRKLGWYELKPPVQRGFKREFVLRDDVKKLKEAKFFENLLSKINTTLYSHRKDFKKKRKQFGKKIYVVREQRLKDLSACEFFGKQLCDAERKYFFEVSVLDNHRRPVTIYRFAEPWRFVLRVQPNMIVRVRMIDYELDQRIEEISRYFSFDNRREKADKLMRGCTGDWYWEENKKYRHPFVNRPLHSIVDEYRLDQTNEERQLNPRASGGFCFYKIFYCTLEIVVENHVLRRAWPDR